MQRITTGSHFFANGPDGLNRSAGIPWDPSYLPSVIGWYDASDPSTVVTDAGAVSEWRSKVGANHFIQATPGNRPAVSAGSLDAEDTIYLDGTKWLDLTTRVTTVRTAAILCKWQDTTGDYRLIFGDGSTYDFHGDTQASAKLLGSSAAATVTGGVKWIDGVSVANPSRYTDWTKHVFVTTGAATIGNFADDRGIAGRNFKGNVAEIILMSSAITDTDRAALQNYWASKYAL